MKFLTRQEQMFLAIVIGLLLTGLGVKWYRTAHPGQRRRNQRQLPPSNRQDQMQEVNFDLKVDRILAKDSRYTREAYVFVREALDYTQKQISRENRDVIRHVNGRELLDGIRQYALQQFGPMAATVLEEWGVKSCPDFGEIVFNMVEIELLAKTEKDNREDFQNGYDFTEAFRKPYWPQSKSKLKPKEIAKLD